MRCQSTFSILNFTNPQHNVSGILRRMSGFALEADFPTSKFCRLRPYVNRNLFCFSLIGSSFIRDSDCQSCSFSRQRSRRNRCVEHCHWSFRIACWWRTPSCSQFGWCFRHWMLSLLEQLGVTPSLWQVADCWFRNSAYWWYRCAFTVTNIDTSNRVDEVDFMPSVQIVLCWFQISLKILNLSWEVLWHSWCLQLHISTAQFVNQLLAFWCPGFMGLHVCSGSLMIEPQILRFHCLDVVLLARVLPLFVEVDQYPVQPPIGQFKILQTCLDIAVFPEPILLIADVAQHFLYFWCSRFGDPLLYVRRVTACLAIILVSYFRNQCSHWSSWAWCLLPEKFEMTVPCLWGNHASASCSSCRTCICYTWPNAHTRTFWEKKNSDFAFQEINQEFESQQFQLHQASRWADQAQRDKISLYLELEMRSRLFHENHARDCQEIEELRSICCEEADRARQARSDELSMQQERNPTTVSQMMAKIRELQNKVNSLSDAREFLRSWIREQLWSDQRSWSNFYDSEFQDLATLRFWIAPKYTEWYWYNKKTFLNDHLLKKTTLYVFRRQQGELWKENRWTRRLNDVTSKVEVECWIILVELILTVVWLIIREFLFRNGILENLQTLWNFQAGKSTSRLRFVYEQPILRSPCSGSTKSRFCWINWRTCDIAIDYRAA